jgi:regulator of replication initiation timing
MRYLLFLFLFLLNACGDQDSKNENHLRERQELQRKVEDLNQVIKEIAGENIDLQAEIDALSGKLADCEKAKPVPSPPIKTEPEPRLESKDMDKQKKLMDFLENLEKRKK